jgi:hypothetical protein
MRPLFLKLDDSLEHQGGLGHASEPFGQVIEAEDLGRQLRGRRAPDRMAALEKRLRGKPPGAAELVFAGSADFANLTPVLLRRAIRASAATAVSVIAWRADGGAQRWMAQLAAERNVRQVLRATDIDGADLADDDLYLSIDKRALAGERAFDDLDRLIERLGRERLIGGAVFGDWSTPAFGGNRVTALARRCLASIGRPLDQWSRRARDQADNILILEMLTRPAVTTAPARLVRVD